jgi:hypothetical protein
VQAELSHPGDQRLRRMIFLWTQVESTWYILFVKNKSSYLSSTMRFALCKERQNSRKQEWSLMVCLKSLLFSSRLVWRNDFFVSFVTVPVPWMYFRKAKSSPRQLESPSSWSWTTPECCSVSIIPYLMSW